MAHRAAVEFQFHKGTIRTNGRIREDRQILQFQFHKGTIRTFQRVLAWRQV